MTLLSALLPHDYLRQLPSRVCLTQKHVWPPLLLFLYSGGRGMLWEGGGGEDRGVGRGRPIFPGYIPGSTSTTAGAIPGRHQQQQKLSQHRHHGWRSSTNASFVPSLDFASSPELTVASFSTRKCSQQIKQRQQRSPLLTLSIQSMTQTHTVSLLSA